MRDLSQTKYADPLLDGKPFREVLVDNRSNASELSDYQVSLSVEDKYLKFDGERNLRFVDENGQILSYWAESGTDFWSKVVRIIGYGIVAIYLIEDVSDISDGNATFDFFDGFEDGDDSDWTEVPGQTGAHAPTVDEAKHGIYSEKLTRDVSYPAIYKSTGVKTDSALIFYSKKPDSSGQVGFRLYSGATRVTYIIHQVTTDDWEYYDGVWRIIQSGATSGQWYKVELNNFNWVSNTMDIYLDGVLKKLGVSFENAASNFNEVQLWEEILSKSNYYDSIIVRKYLSPEPVTYIGVGM